MVKHGGIFIGLGSNLGDRERHLKTALAELDAGDDIEVVTCSSFHETEPLDGPADQPQFLNAVAEISTNIGPRALLTRLHEIEQRHGRTREVSNGPRTLDLDLLIYRDRVVDEPDLCVPHPRMWQRSFVLQPLAEICDLGRLVSAYRLGHAAESETRHHVCRRSDGAAALA